MKKVVVYVIIVLLAFSLSAYSKNTRTNEMNLEDISFKTADETFKAYKKALLESDSTMIYALTPNSNPETNAQEIWDTIEISKVTLIKKDIRENNACYSLELDISDGGSSAFETGVFPRWLYLIKGENGWYVDGLMTSGEPDENWWNKQ